jgi:hypothetical protein
MRALVKSRNEDRKYRTLVIQLWQDENDIELWDQVSAEVHRRSGRRNTTHRDVLQAVMSAYVELHGLEVKQ